MSKSVILIQPNYRVKKDASYWAANPPLGLCYLASVLEKNHISVEILDCHVRNLSASQTARIIRQKKPDFVGFSILTPAADWCYAVVKKIKKLPLTIIAGGPHVSGLPQEAVKKGFDYVVVGEGEQVLLDIVQGKKMTGKIIMAKPLNPNRLPLPARHLLVKGGTDKPYFSSGTLYYPWAPIITSRGCPYNCYFCNKKTFGYQFRPRTPENVLKEIDSLVANYQVREIDFYDDCFNYDIERAGKIMDLIAGRRYDLHLRFSNGLRADKITPRLLRKMKKAGTEYIAYGIESGDEKVLAQIPKVETLKQIEKSIRMTKKAGITMVGFFIFGLIGDTLTSMQKTIDFMVKLPFDQVILNIATPFPGTKMWQMIKENKGKLFIKNWQDFFNTSGKMLYHLPGMATPSEVEMMYRRANRAFYFRPKYIIKQMPKLLSFKTMPVMYRGLRRILYALKNEKNN